MVFSGVELPTPWGPTTRTASPAAPALAAPATADDPIRIRLAVAHSGWMSSQDVEPHRGAMMRVEAINAATGLPGRQMETWGMDTRTDQPLAATAGQQRVADGADLRIVSCGHDHWAPAALAASEAGVMNISMCAGGPKMGAQGMRPFTFTANTWDRTECIAMAEYASQVIGIGTVYILESPATAPPR